MEQLDSANSFDDILGVFASIFGSVVVRNFGELDSDLSKLRKAMSAEGTSVEGYFSALANLSKVSSANQDLAMAAGVSVDEIRELRRKALTSGPQMLLGAYKSNGVVPGVGEIGAALLEAKEKYAELIEQRKKVWADIAGEYNPKILEAEKAFVVPLQEEQEAFYRKWREASESLLARRPNIDLEPEEYEKWRAVVEAHEEENRNMNKIHYQGMRDAYAEHVDPLRDELNKKIETNPLNQELIATQEEKKRLVAELHEKTLNTILGKSPITEAQAKDWIKTNAILEKKALAKASKAGYKREQIEADLALFYRMTQGRLPRLEFTTVRKQRSQAAHWSGVLYVGSNFGKRTFFHELAHLLEDDPKVLAAAQAFLESRRESSEPVPLRQLIPGSNYGSNEVAYKDSFFDPYVGKHYSNATEVLSMGLQMLSSPELLAELQVKDPEHFAFVVGLCATTPHIDTARTGEKQADLQQKKEKVKKIEGITKELDKKIAKAGEFWVGHEIKVEPRYGKSFTIFLPQDDNGRTREYAAKTWKIAKIALYLWIANGKPERGEYSLGRLTYSLGYGNKTLPDSLLTSGEIPAL